jgi:creatinine amidohydrolase
MRWEHLAAKTFEEAVVQAQGVCIIPIGVLEYHGPHLPLGTDMLHSHALACAAAAQEPVVVYPAYHFGVNVETKHFPGGIVVKDRLMFELLENICDEISRNGLKKIVLLSGHGGNRYFLPLFVQLTLDKGKDYTLYYVQRLGDQELAQRIAETEVDGHAGEQETSEALYVNPELVRMDLLDESDRWPPQQRLDHLANVYTPADWSANFPDHCTGDPRPATGDKGRILFESQLADLVELLATIKADTAASGVYAEFGSRIYHR